MGFFSVVTSDTKRSVPCSASSNVKFFPVYVKVPGRATFKAVAYDGYGRFISESGQEVDCQESVIDATIRVTEDSSPEDYSPSRRCQFQGYFYPPGFKNDGTELD